MTVRECNDRGEGKEGDWGGSQMVYRVGGRMITFVHSFLRLFWGCYFMSKGSSGSISRVSRY